MSDTQVVVRKIITYVVTIILLGISFAAVYGLSVAQVNNAGNTALAFLISMVISIINIILGRTISNYY